jgi:hypothetical protein
MYEMNYREISYIKLLYTMELKKYMFTSPEKAKDFFKVRQLRHISNTRGGRRDSIQKK